MNNAAISPVGLLQAVSDVNRLRLLRLLHRQELNVQELVAALEMRQPSVSRHLAILREAGWVSLRREGTWSWYSTVSTSEFPGGAALQQAIVDSAESIEQASADDRRLATVIAEREMREREFFPDAADHWDQIRIRYEHPDLQAGMVAALVPPGLQVIDVGTGTGALLPILARTAQRVVAVDRSTSLLASAQRRCRAAGCANVWFQQADVRALPFADDAFAGAYASMVLHHVDDPGAALRELARVVRPGCPVVVLEFTRHNLNWMRHQLAHRWLGFDRSQLSAWCEGAGLKPRQWLQRKRATDDRVDSPIDPSSREGFTWPDILLLVAQRRRQHHGHEPRQ
jgi:ubiquinone/menaquinone biosynthesis C-methylase UbiE/DNA-binding transcriptional ArsR family regulator